MAHELHVKARAVAAMMTGAGVRETARAYKLPVSTVSRWRQTDVLPRMREIGRRYPELAALGLRLRSLKMGHKKGRSR